MPSKRRKQFGEEPGMGLLFSKMATTGLDTIPRVTLILIVFKVLQYQQVIKLPWEKLDICISAEEVLYNKDYKRFIFSIFEHADERDLYFNMVSFLIKGRTLETNYGSANFALLLIFLIFLTNSFYIAIAFFGSMFLGHDSLMSYCSIGFSGIVFALKVVTTAEIGTGKAYLMGFEVPSKYAAWAELIAIRQVVPSSPVLSQLAGVVAGCAYISSPLGLVVDSVIATLTGSYAQDLPYRNTRKVENKRVSNKTKPKKVKTNVKNN